MSLLICDLRGNIVPRVAYNFIYSGFNGFFRDSINLKMNSNT